MLNDFKCCLAVEQCLSGEVLRHRVRGDTSPLFGCRRQGDRHLGTAKRDWKHFDDENAVILGGELTDRGLLSNGSNGLRFAIRPYKTIMQEGKMELQRLNYDLTICKVESESMIDLHSDFCFVGKTDDEISLVCLTKNVPVNTVERDDGWKGLRIRGVLDFSLIGILARISSILAENRIGIFAVSTFNTDYILVKEENFNRALDALEREGYRIVEN